MKTSKHQNNKRAKQQNSKAAYQAYQMYTLHSLPCFTVPNLEENTSPIKKEKKKMRLDQTIAHSELKYLSKKGKAHDPIEHWLGDHNRKFEMVRTITSLISATTSSLVLLKVFGII